MTTPGDRDPKAGDQPPLELELADVPRRMPRSVQVADARYERGAPGSGTTTPPPAGAQAQREPPLPAQTLPPAMLPLQTLPSGRSLLDEPSPWPRRIFLLVLLGAFFGGGYYLYRRIFRANIVAVSSPYRSSTGVTLDLPGKTGWHSDRRARLKETRGENWMRGDLMFRAAKPEEANELVMVLRVHSPGAFARAIDPEELRRGLEAALRQAATSAMATTKNLSCVLEHSWRSTTGVACYGVIVMPYREMAAGAYLWIHDDDDVIGIGYANADAVLEPLETMARTAR